MVGCAVDSCKRRSETLNFSKDGVSYHTFPKNPILKNKWTQLCSKRPNWKPTRTSTICSVHFESSQFQCLPNKRRKLVDNAVPTLFLSETKNETVAQILPGTSPCEECVVNNNTVKLKSNIELSPRKKIMKMKMEGQARKIKKLQSQTKYLKKKVASLKELLKTLNDKSLIDMGPKPILQNIGVNNEELLKREIG